MARDQRAHVERIRKDFQASQRVKDSLNNSIQALAHDLYSKETHFIFELIQNAEDNTYKETEPSLSFRLVKTNPTNTQNAIGALIIQNNEIGFSPDDVDAICAVGKTTKSKIQGYIGEKGIGFKSVFRITTMPHIFSGGYRFCLPEEDKETGLGYIVPRWLEKPLKGIDHSRTTIILPLDKPDFAYKKIEEMLRDIEPETILFLSKLKEIQIETDTGDKLTILKDNSKEPLIQILIEGEQQGKPLSNIDEFLLYTKTVDKPEDVNHEKRIDIDKRDVSIAFPLNENKESAGKIFAYLPVRSDTGLPFLINADFILTSSREEIRGKVRWNEWLMKCVANLLADSLLRLKEREQLTVDLLEALAKRINDFDESSMFYPIVGALRDAFLGQELLPADDGTFVAARNAKLAHRAELRKLLSQNQLRSLFQLNDEIKWLSGKITRDLTPDLRNYLTKELDVKEVTPDSFANRIEENFLANQTDKWIIELYKYLNKVPYSWKPNQDSPLLFRSKPIIKTEDDKLIAPYSHKLKYHSYGSYMTEDQNDVFLPPEGETSFTIVKRCVASDDEARQFLKNLGLKEPDIYDEIYNKIFPKYDSDSDISPEEHKRHIDTVLRAIRSGGEAKRNKLIEKIKSLKFILAINSATNDCDYKQPKDLYFQTEGLKTFFEGNSDVWFIDEELSEKFKTNFSELGVSDIIRIENRTRDNLKENRIIWERKHKIRGVNGFDYRCKINGLEYALNNPVFERSKFIWNNLLRQHIDSIKGMIESKEDVRYVNADFVADKSEVKYSLMGQLLIEKPWLPDEQGIFHKPGELGLDDLPDTFQRNEKLVDQLEMKKDVVAKLAEEAGVSVDDINLIKQLKEHPEEYEKVKMAISAKKEKPSFPENASLNVERRKKKITEKYHKAPKKKYEKKTISKKTTENTIDPGTWLRETYTNKEGQMICQICQKEMPFKKKNGKYYFEAIELLNYFDREMEELHVALCPLCAAMYNEFVKHDEGAMGCLKNTLMNSEEAEVSLQLGELDTSIRFVGSHWSDIRTILQEMDYIGLQPTA